MRIVLTSALLLAAVLGVMTYAALTNVPFPAL